MRRCSEWSLFAIGHSTRAVCSPSLCASAVFVSKTVRNVRHPGSIEPTRNSPIGSAAVVSATTSMSPGCQKQAWLSPAAKGSTAIVMK